ncbi:MAG: deoxyribodipyrimidine photo-lyase [Legionella sp.]|nr:deoxyribodipyrimidine photo-lyase [Legionella sp.]
MNTALVWFRQDLRLADNPALSAALTYHNAVILLYIYDSSSSSLGGAQQWWLHHSLQALSDSLKKQGLNLVLRQGDPLQIIEELTQQFAIDTIYWNRCYEPAAIKRDTQIKAHMALRKVNVTSCNGSLLNEPWTIKNKAGDYFKVFTPYWKHCLQNTVLPTLPLSSNQAKNIDTSGDTLEKWNLLPQKPNWASAFSQYWQPGEKGAQNKLEEFINTNLRNYKSNRDIPEKNATSRLSPHLHFGEISPWAIWSAVALAKLDKDCDLPSAEHFLSELGWREFSYYLLYHVPTLPHKNFRKEFDAFPWHQDESALKRWQTGTTGYPLVDAGMRELWATGYMHNRVRMIAASFLTKDLLLDWRLGAAWFLDTLLDADLANNSASWQWVAGCGADAAPYFRIFNPVKQSMQFDPNGTYIRQWIPELAAMDNKEIHKPWTCTKLHTETNYPAPIVEHHEARQKALEYYQTLKNIQHHSEKEE